MEKCFWKRSCPTTAGDDVLVNALLEMSIADIRKLVATATEEELEFMLDGVAMNESLADILKPRQLAWALLKICVRK